VKNAKSLIWFAGVTEVTGQPATLLRQRWPLRGGYDVHLRGGFFDAVRMRRAMVRNASLAALASGKISATSRSRGMRLLPSAYRAAVTPRTALEKSYSGRIVSLPALTARILPLLFFILLSFM
jgi:hypothetical protein